MTVEQFDLMVVILTGIRWGAGITAGATLFLAIQSLCSRR